MNVIQLVRRARQGVDAILPGGYASSQWDDSEVVECINEAYEFMHREFRLVNKKWGLVTLNTDDTAFAREGETYNPATALVLSGSSQRITLPPDFAELVRITCTSNRDIRFFPAEMQGEHFMELEQNTFGDAQTVAMDSPTNMTFYYDLIGYRTLHIAPTTSGTFDLEIDYIPMRRPLYYTNAGVVSITIATTAITGTGTLFLTDNILTEDFNQRAEVIVGVSDPQSNAIRVDKDYPRIASISSDTVATLKSTWFLSTVTDVPYIVAMAPTFPREYHRWLSRLASSLMLSKVNPDVAEKYFSRFMTQFREQINPAIRRRQSQASPVVEDATEFSQGGDW